MTNPNDHDLVSALQQGDVSACDELIKQYSPSVYNVALRLTNHPTEAEDVLQETFINACRNGHKFEGRSSLHTWLYRIATNNSLMRQRKKRVNTVPLEPTDETGETLDFEPTYLSDWAWEPESMTLTDELRHTMDEAVSALPESLRAVFVLRDLQGLSTQETAESLNISVSNVKVRLHRARLTLREYLATYFIEREANA